jgi:hypothetical protein
MDMYFWDVLLIAADPFSTKVGRRYRTNQRRRAGVDRE